MNRRGIRNIVNLDGLTPYLQAGDLGIYKSFKDKISLIIATWKASREVQYTACRNPRLPKPETVAQWVITAWRNVNAFVILNSIKAAEFGVEAKWHIYKHDVYVCV